MKKTNYFSLFTLLLFFFNLNKITAQETYSLKVYFTGMKSDIGDVYIGLHNNDKDFLKKRYREACAKTINKKASFTFKDLPEGEYAISAFHDENENHKIDTNFIGIPKEPIGISNNAKGFLGPPKYKDAKLLISKNTEITINIQ